ncbi:MAG: hypothetical protein OEM04_11415, partial [Flavobacteriaceae bacterium]|nr:hypothetical protein [Flavobacteriaceae bacterium]
VNDKYAWKYGNEHGYFIERTTVMRDGKPLKEPIKTILTGGAIKPKPLKSWESFTLKNDMAAVAAQAIYGEDFEMNEAASSNQMLRVVQESEALDRRFGFSLFAMDQDFEVAKFAGLGFVDSEVRLNEKYLYKIRSAVPKETLMIKDSGVFISPSDQDALPRPIDFVGYHYKNSFVLVWEYDLLLPYYTSYDLERSEDGILFKKVNKVPITKLADTKSSGISYTDSIVQFNKKFWYRVVGNSVFNEKSKPSKPIELLAYEDISAIPVFKESVLLSEKEAVLEWSFPKEEESLVKQFDLLRAATAIGPYKVVEEGISPSKRSYRYQTLESINYFKLNTIAKSGKSQLSSPTMVQPVDSIAPVKPKNLTGTIDTLGVVKLSWTANEEPDLKGYKIFKANRPNQEFMVLNKYSETATNYIDTVNLQSFNKKVYYKIQALDHRYNASQYSEILTLVRPDKIPPTSPVFDTYNQDNGKVYLKWIKSSSDDIAKEVVYRKEAGIADAYWEKIYETKTDTTAYFVDGNLNPGTKYLYTLVAIDQAGLESPPSPPLTIDLIKNLLKPAVKGLYTTVDREHKLLHLFWKYNSPDVHEFLIYKKKNSQAFSLFRTAKPEEKQLIDMALHPNTTYHYGIKAIFKDGSMSQWAEIEVVY